MLNIYPLVHFAMASWPGSLVATHTIRESSATHWPSRICVTHETKRWLTNREEDTMYDASPVSKVHTRVRLMQSDADTICNADLLYENGAKEISSSFDRVHCPVTEAERSRRRVGLSGDDTIRFSPCKPILAPRSRLECFACVHTFYTMITNVIHLLYDVTHNFYNIQVR